MPFFPVVGTVLSTTSNVATTATGVAVSGSWISKHTAGSAIKRCRNTLHHTMNILDEIVEKDLDVPEGVILELRTEHEVLTSTVDKLQKRGAQISFWTLDGPKKTYKLLMGVHEVEDSAELLRSQVQRTSDIAKNKKMGNGRLVIHQTSSTWSLISIRSRLAASTATTTLSVLQEAGEDGVNLQHAGADPAATSLHPGEQDISDGITDADDRTRTDAIQIDLEPDEFFIDNQSIVSIVIEPNPWDSTTTLHHSASWL